MNVADLALALSIGTSMALLLWYALTFFGRSTRKRELSLSRIKKLEEHLPSFLDSISSGLAVGNSLQHSMESFVHRDGSPMSEFIKSITQRVRTGMPLDASLELQAREVTGGSLSLAFFSIASSYRSGSNMIESLSLIADICREREHLRKKILARTAQSRTQGYVLIFVPVLFMVILYIVSPHNMLPVLSTPIGKSLLFSAVILQCLGGLTIRSMLKQEIL